MGSLCISGYRLGSLRIKNVPRIEVEWHWLVSLLCLRLRGEGRAPDGGEVAAGWKDGVSGPRCFQNRLERKLPYRELCRKREHLEGNNSVGGNVRVGRRWEIDEG